LLFRFTLILNSRILAFWMTGRNFRSCNLSLTLIYEFWFWIIYVTISRFGTF
jgi:hypothetical protein